MDYSKVYSEYKKATSKAVRWLCGATGGSRPSVNQLLAHAEKKTEIMPKKVGKALNRAIALRQQMTEFYAMFSDPEDLQSHQHFTQT